MFIQFTTATTDADLQQILDLQAANQKANLSADYQQQFGFVTLIHTLSWLRTMNEAAPHIIAKEGDRVVGYALTLVPVLGELIPAMRPLLTMIDELTYQEQPLTHYRYYFMGQVCVAESHRGQGVFDGLYAAHRQQFADRFDVLITDISLRNTRSRRAHERVGFQTLCEYDNHHERWAVVVWDWRTQNS